LFESAGNRGIRTESGSIKTGLKLQIAAAMPGRIEAVLVPDTNRRSRLPSQTLKTRFLRAIPIAPRCKCTVFATAFTG